MLAGVGGAARLTFQGNGGIIISRDMAWSARRKADTLGREVTCLRLKVTGDCIMPREDVFTRVLHGGTISVGDELTILNAQGDIRRTAIERE